MGVTPLEVVDAFAIVDEDGGIFDEVVLVEMMLLLLRCLMLLRL